MGRGGYYGGSTVVGPASGWFTFREEENYHAKDKEGCSSETVTYDTREIKNVSPNDQKDNLKAKPIVKIIPNADDKIDSSFIVWALPERTNRIKSIHDLSDADMKLLGLDPNKYYRQITLIDNSAHQNKSYTALVSLDLLRGIEVGKTVKAKMVAIINPDFCWRVIRINPL